MSKSNFGECFLAFLGGAAVGAAVGILMAPDKGINTRRKIIRTTHDVKRSVEDKIEDMKDAVSDLMDEIKETAETFTHHAEEVSNSKKS